MLLLLRSEREIRTCGALCYGFRGLCATRSVWDMMDSGCFLGVSGWGVGCLVPYLAKEHERAIAHEIVFRARHILDANSELYGVHSSPSLGFMPWPLRCFYHCFGALDFHAGIL